MSGLLCVRLLLLWGCVCLWLPCLAWTSLVTTGDHNAAQNARGVARSLQKRSISPAKMEVCSVIVDCTVMSRFARTVMTSVALNTANISQEISFEVDLPKKAFISNFSMEIDGREYVGQVKEKKKAKKQYQKAISSGQTAGLVKASGRKMEKFSVSVNIAAKSNVTFILTYEELLQRKLGQYEILTRVKPKSLVQDFKINTDIYEPQGIAFLDAHATFITNELLPLVKKTVSAKKAQISFSPTFDQQRKCPGCDGTLINGDFIIKYDVDRANSFGDIQIMNGYFVHFFAPNDLHRIPKNVVFVIDVSGSMSGRKIDQTKEALLKILSDVHEEDYFALIKFDHSVYTWRNSLTKATKENVSEAMTFVRQLDDMGSTNINDAVLRGVKMLTKDRQEKTVPERNVDMIILLTDGMPNSGVSQPEVVQENVRSAIGGKMSLFCLGFGNDVDYSFLDVMSQQNKGLARRIYEASDAALQLQGFYDEVASPLLSEVDLRYPDNEVDVLTTNHFSHFFTGSEIVVAGHLAADLDNILVEVLGQGFENDFKVQGKASTEELYPDEEYIFGDFTERLWAYLTIQQLLKKSKSDTPEEKANATARALDISLQYNFVTPLTSMVVTKPEAELGTNSTHIADKLTEDERQQADRGAVLQTAPLYIQTTQHVHEPYVTNVARIIESSPDFLHVARVIEALPPQITRVIQMSLEDRQQGRWALSQAAKVTEVTRVIELPLSNQIKRVTQISFVDGDPHFMIELPEKNDALCFNINERQGTIFSMVRDPESGILVNGQLIGDKKIPPDGKINTYFWRFGIVHRTLGVRLQVSTYDISVFQDNKWYKLLWSEKASLKGLSVDLVVTKDHSLIVTLHDSVKFVVLLHKVWAKHPYHRDYLGFYTLDSHLLSTATHGLLGQFYHGIEYEVSELRPGKVPEKPDATMFVKGHQLNVTRGWQRDFRRDVKNGENVPCWFIHNNGNGLIDGNITDYIVTGLFKTV